MRAINHIVLHCTATPRTAKVSSIINYWKNNLGWKSPGYHFLIDGDGIIHELLDISKMSNGVRGHNHDSIHISYVGGVNKNGEAEDTRTEAQIVAMLKLLLFLLSEFPDAEILGHRDFKGVNKACPSFDVRKWLQLGFNQIHKY